MYSSRKRNVWMRVVDTQPSANSAKPLTNTPVSVCDTTPNRAETTKTSSAANMLPERE